VKVKASYLKKLIKEEISSVLSENKDLSVDVEKVEKEILEWFTKNNNEDSK